MKKEILFTMHSPFRDDFRITGFRFGEGEKSVAIVGSMRGDEIQQLFVCSQMVKLLTEIEQNGAIMPGHEILVIPSVNPFSMNIEKRFWAMDNTDINRMFPGYDKGETTQRIAASLFECVKGYNYGIQLASFYMPGEFVPHVRMMETGYQDTIDAKLFEFPYIFVRKPKPYDTTVLNYNWQLWNTFAFSIYAGQTNAIDKNSAKETECAILRFLNKKGIINYQVRNGYASEIITEQHISTVKAETAGIYYKIKSANDDVAKGDVLAQILNPYDGSVLSEVKSPINGTIFFAHNKPLALENSPLFNIIKSSSVKE